MPEHRKLPIHSVTWYGKYTSPGEWPDWFNTLVSYDALKPQENGELELPTRKGLVLTRPGDEIVKDGSAELYVDSPGSVI